MEGKVAEKFTKRSFREGPPRGEEPIELTEVVEEPSDDNYVLYGKSGRAKSRRRSLIDLDALEEVALREAQRAMATFLAEHGEEVLAEEAREVLAETAAKVGPRVAEAVFREKATEVLAGVAEEAALKAAREVVQAVAAGVIERLKAQVREKLA